MKITEQYDYPELEAITKENGTRVYITPDNEHLPSVTTILGATSDKTALDSWRERIGNTEADRQVKEAINVGNVMHDSVERYVLGLERPIKGNLVHKMGRTLADNIITKGLCDVTEVWGVETALWYPGLYAGRTDLVGCHKCIPAIMDHKNAKKIKKEEWMEGYFCQATAYGLAHDHLHGTKMKKAAIFMASRDYDYKTFILEGAKYDYYQQLWLQKLEQYYEMVEKGQL